MGRIRQGYQKNNYVGSFFQWFCQVTAKAFWDWRDICWTRLWKAWQLFGRSSWQLLSFWFLCLLFFVTTFSKLFMLKQFRWHLKSSTCTSWSTTNGGATTVGRWRKAWGLDFGGPKSNGPTMWATARFSSGWWTNAMVIPAWHLRWLTPWPQPFWMGFSERTCFFFTKCFCWVFLLCQIVRDHSNRLRDYSQDLDAILLAKPQRFTPEMTAMWQDHVGRAILRPQGSMKEDESEALDQAQDTRRKLFDFLFGAFWKNMFMFLLALLYYFGSVTDVQEILVEPWRKRCYPLSMGSQLQTWVMITEKLYHTTWGRTRLAFSKGPTKYIATSKL